MEQKLSNQHLTLESHLKRAQKFTGFIAVVAGVLSSLAVVYGFYYSTSDTLSQHTEEIKEVKKDVSIIKKDIGDAAVFQGVSQEQMKALKEEVAGIKNQVNKMDDKFDKMNDKIDIILSRNSK